VSKFRWGLLLTAVLVVAGSAIGATALAQPKRAAAPAAEPLKIALSNSFIGNKWRIEMENVYKAACKMPPYKQQVKCAVYNSGNDVSKQTQQISNLVSSGVDSFMVCSSCPQPSASHAMLQVPTSTLGLELQRRVDVLFTAASEVMTEAGLASTGRDPACRQHVQQVCSPCGLLCATSEQPVLLARSSRILCRHLIRAQGANWIGGAPVTSIERQPLRGAGTCTDAAFMSESSVR